MKKIVPRFPDNPRSQIAETIKEDDYSPDREIIYLLRVAFARRFT
ncbi:hypothetical protein [Frankia gtarii]|nr:hypothetical protein [Frankia gtarii]